MQREVLKWKLTTRREDGSTEFRITHAEQLGEKGVKQKELELAKQVNKAADCESSSSCLAGRQVMCVYMERAN